MKAVKPKNAKVKTLYIQGLDGRLAEVEASIFPGLPSFEVVGLGDSAIREAKERVRASIRSCGYEFPGQRIVVNISPAYLHKSGSSFDLPIALSILLASGQIVTKKAILAYGELSLTGEIRPIPGAVSRLLVLEHADCDVNLVPYVDRKEAALLNTQVEGVSTLQEAVCRIDQPDSGETEEPPMFYDPYFPEPEVDISCLKGQPAAARAIILAAAGFHNILLCGSPGTGKSLSAKILRGILPPLTNEEKIELLKVESALSVLSEGVTESMERPFRYVHHTCTPTAMVGGGRIAVPGEISRALHGVLFLDELPEFSPKVLDLLRVPLETGRIEISRNEYSNIFPARFMLTAAMNPCRCGKCIDDPSSCTCTPTMIRSYQGRISGALLDRMDIYCYLSKISEEALLQTIQETTERESPYWRERIGELWERQYTRCEEMGVPHVRNGECQEGALAEMFRIGQAEREYAAMAAHQMNLSVRGLKRLMRLSRTIADLDEKKDVLCEHITEAISFRLPSWSEKKA